MKLGESRYTDALDELSRFGPAVFTQTGGMCAALELTLERGYLLVTDVDDSLPWSRAWTQGWGVGFYRSEDTSEGPERVCEQRRRVDRDAPDARRAVPRSDGLGESPQPIARRLSSPSASSPDPINLTTFS